MSTNTALIDLRVPSNQLISMDVSSNIVLEHLDFWVNQLTTLDLSQNVALATLKVSSNNIIALDLSANTILTTLYCENNQLTTLNMRNGVTDSLNTFNATNNPDLTCIETLDPEYATANWTNANGNIDDGVTFSVICGSEGQDVWHVATTGSDGSGSGTQESPFATIQMGINAAGDGNTVHVAAGTYVENINFNGKNIALIGEDKETTIIDGSTRNGQAFKIYDGSDNAVLENFTIDRGGPTSCGGSNNASIVVSDASPTLRNLKIIDSKSRSIEFINSSSLVESVEISNGGIVSCDGGGIRAYQSDITLESVLIEYNEGGQGGGVYFEYSSRIRGYAQDLFIPLGALVNLPVDFLTSIPDSLRSRSELILSLEQAED